MSTSSCVEAHSRNSAVFAQTTEGVRDTLVGIVLVQYRDHNSGHPIEALQTKLDTSLSSDQSSSLAPFSSLHRVAQPDKVEKFYSKLVKNE